MRTACALIVMPRSRSRSSWSSTCSTMSRGATVPVYSSRRSESVVLPWSTCAMTEMARVRWVGVDTHGVYRANKKGRPRGRPTPHLRLLVFLHVRSKVRCLELSFRPLFRGLRVYLSRVIHRFTTADVLAFESWVVAHPITSLSA